jgi:uncharacterized protein YdeI (BOF family)
MSFQFDTLHLTHQLTTGIGYPYCFGLDEKIIRGSVYLDGPTITGDETTFKTVEGSVMIGPCNNTDSPLPKVCDGTILNPSFSFSVCLAEVVGNPKGFGLADPYSLVVRSGPHLTRDPSTACSLDGAGPGATRVTESDSAALFIGDVDITGYTRIANELAVGNDASFGSDVVINGEVFTGSNVKPKGNVDAQGEVWSNCRRHRLSAKKNFDIPHPTKEGWRLTHACVEGPEAAVYVRGRVKNQTEIHLPEYWTKLVDPDTITVSLTPIGSHQDVIIKRIGDNKIYLQSKGGMPIDCFYHIFGERNDTEKLIPEYQGTIEDYPGDNTQRSIAGYDYDTKE